MTTLRIEWDYDEDDQIARTAESDRFFAAWVNQFGIIEYTCTDENAFGDLLRLQESEE